MQADLCIAGIVNAENGSGGEMLIGLTPDTREDRTHDVLAGIGQPAIRRNWSAGRP